MWALDEYGVNVWVPDSIEVTAPVTVDYIKELYAKELKALEEVYPKPKVETEQEKQERLWAAIREFSGG